MDGRDETERWSADAEVVFAEIRVWRADHPTATWVEIQRAVDGRLQRLRERMLTDTAQASSAADFAGSTARPVCPRCGDALQADGRKTRRLRTEQGGTIALRRTHGRCPRCHAGLFPPG